MTGVSTGALIAPFAFLGPAYDKQLRDVYTTISADDIFSERGLIGGIFDDAMADTTPLWDLISKYVDEPMMAAIAREYQKGRLLLIGTTDLDAERANIWNIGAIAASGNPGALDLIRKILRASSAVPGFFQPVMIDVELDGKHYQELHVDGGAIAQMFLYPPNIDIKQAGSPGAEGLLDPQCPRRPGVGGRGTSDAEHRRPGGLHDDSLPAARTICCGSISSRSATASITTSPTSAATSRRRMRETSTRPT